MEESHAHITRQLVCVFEALLFPLTIEPEALFIPSPSRVAHSYSLTLTLHGEVAHVLTLNSG